MQVLQKLNAHWRDLKPHPIHIDGGPVAVVRASAVEITVVTPVASTDARPLELQGLQTRLYAQLAKAAGQ